MSARSLFEPVIDGGIANPNWFEGRLLTAEAMRAKDKAERTRQRLLGRAIGAGVFEGLFVSRGTAADNVVKTLNVSKGAALNGEGEVLLLSRDVTVDVVPAPSPVALAPSLFAPCEPSSLPTIPNGFGLYVLLMAPVSAYRERAPKSGLGTEGVVTGCGDAFAVDGVQFRTEKLEPSTISGLSDGDRDVFTALLADTGDATSLSMLRNLAAHYCFGTPEQERFPADPFARTAGASESLEYGAIDDLKRLGRITPCDVPIALLLWAEAGVTFVDVWAVRRSPIEPVASRAWPLMASRRRDHDARARFLQFQGQLAETGSAALTGGEARSGFRYLPPAGIVPLARAGIAGGFDRGQFFAGCTTRRPAYMNGARVLALLEESFVFPPTDLLAPRDAPRTTLVWLYFVYENGAVIDRVLPGQAGHALLIFANGNLPFMGEARFDVSRWNYANYSPR
jgi:hypothetical protein